MFVDLVDKQQSFFVGKKGSGSDCKVGRDW